jgi:hypothetical protein
MVLPASEVSAFIFFFPSFCGTGKIMAENQPPAKTHFRQQSCNVTARSTVACGGFRRRRIVRP